MGISREVGGGFVGSRSEWVGVGWVGHQIPTKVHGAYVRDDAETASPQNPVELLTYRDAAKILKVCSRTVETIARERGEIPIIRVNKTPRLRRSDVLSYIERGGSKPQVE